MESLYEFLLGKNTIVNPIVGLMLEDEKGKKTGLLSKDFEFFFFFALGNTPLHNVLLVL